MSECGIMAAGYLSSTRKSRSREYGGVGLGLSLVWEIASLHGGRVFAEESSENGTVMLVTLPKGKINEDLQRECVKPE